MAHKLKLNPIEFELIAALLEKQYGIQFEYNKSYLIEQALTERMKKMNISSFHTYYQLINNYINSEEELSNLILLLTVGETYFFRNENHFKAMTHFIIPDLLKNRHHIDILSAGCATGEEPYSLVILLNEHFPHASFSISAVDINREYLAKAQKGHYSKRSLMQTPDSYIEQYFKKKGSNYKLSQHIIDQVNFIEGNLIDDVLYNNRQFDLILCRNVIIYFPITVIKKVVNLFKSILLPHGYLIHGHSEILRGITDDFGVIEKCGTFFYQLIQTPINSKPAHVSQNTSQIPPPIFLEAKTSTRDNIHCKEKNQKAFTDTPKKSIEQQSFLNPEKEYLKGLQYLQNEQPKKAEIIFKAILTDFPDDITTLLGMALIEGSSHHLDEARKYCQRVFAIDNFSPEAYFITGLLYETENNPNKAQKAYQDTVFLNNNFIPAHFKLAELNYNLQQYKQAILSYRNVLRYLSQESDRIIFLYLGGFTKETIQTLCEQRVIELKMKRSS